MVEVIVVVVVIVCICKSLLVTLLGEVNVASLQWEDSNHV